MKTQETQIEWDHLHELSDGDVDFEIELLQLFVEDSLGQVSALEAAIATQNATQVERVAHHLKGASANVGAKPISQLASEIEEQARRSHFQGMQTLVQALQSSLSQIQIYVVSQV